MSFVALGGYKFAVKGKVREFFVQRQTQPFRLQGVQSRTNDASVNRFFFDSFPLGIGFQEMHRETGYGVGGLLDSTAETRFNGIFPSGLAETQTHAAPADHFKKAVNFKGDFWGAHEQEYSATALQCTCVTKFGASTDTWVAVDAPMYNDSTAGTATTASSITVSHTVQGTYGNQIVIAIASYSGGAGGAVTGVTYAGAAMTLLARAQSASNNDLSIWYRVAPTTGANDCVATLNFTADRVHLHVADYYFVNQTTPFGTAVTAADVATSTSLAVTTTAGDLVIGGVMHAANEATAVGANLFEREDAATATASAEYSEGRATGASTTWAASWTTNSTERSVAAPLLAAGFVSAPRDDVTLGTRLFDMVAHKASLFILRSMEFDPSGTASELLYKISSSTDGDAWVDASGTGWPDNSGTNLYLITTITRRNNFDDDMGRLLSYGNVLLAAIRRHPDSTNGATLSDVEVLSSTDSGTNWASDVTIPSGDGPKAFVDWLDLAGARSPVLVLADGIYSVNTTANTYEKIYDLDGDPANGRWAEVDNMGALRVGLGSGQILVLNISDTGHLTTYISGPPGDGLVTARQGHVNYMLRTPSEWFFVSYGGHAASRTASVFAIDSSVILTDPETGKWYNPWHHIWVDTTGNLDIVALGYSTEDDAKPRLHFAVEGAAASINYHIEEPLTNPKTTTTKKYLASSYVRLPEDDLGDPHSATMMLLAQVRAKSLSAATTGDYISHQYGIDGDADTTVTLGSYLSGDLDLPFFSTGSITAFADGSNGLVTVTDATHGLLEGDSVTISGTTSYNGTFTIQDVTTNTFAIRDTWVADDATGTWHCYKGVSAKTIAHRLTLIRDAATTTDRVHLQEFEYQGQNVYLDKKAWQFTIDVENSPVDVVGGTNKAETIKTNIQNMASGGVLLPFEFSESSGVIYVRVPNDSPPVFDLDIVGSDEVNRGFTSGDVLITVEEGF